MIKKLLMAIAAIAMLMGTAVAVSVVRPSVAGAATPPTNYNCAIGGSVTFKTPGISAGGALTAATSVTTKTTATLTGSGCSTLPIKITVASATTPCPQTNGVPNSGDPAACQAQKNGVYAITTKPNYYDTSAQYATNGVSDLQAALQAKPPKTTIDGVSVTLSTGTAAQVLPGGACGSAAGFQATGQALSGSTPVSNFTLLACLTGDSGPNTTGNFITDISGSTATIATATLGGPSSLTLSLPNMGCTVAGAVTFKSPGLSAGGSLTSATSVTTKSSTTPTGTNCSGSPIGVTIASATTPCPQTNGVPNSGDPAACQAQKNGVYAITTKPNYYDTNGSFASSGLSDLQAALQAKPLKTTVGGIPVLLTYGTAAQVLPGGVCGSTDVGFHLTGNVSYKTASNVVGTYTDNACISSDTGPNTTGNFVTDLGSSTATIATAIIGGASLLNVTFNP